jgi:hypothetical protein
MYGDCRNRHQEEPWNFESNLAGQLSNRTRSSKDIDMNSSLAHRRREGLYLKALEIIGLEVFPQIPSLVFLWAACVRKNNNKKN